MKILRGDPRVLAGARALAEKMGASSDWKLWIPEAQIVLQAAEDTP